MYRTRVSVPAAVASFLASLALLFLSSLEHSRSIRPSSLINTYVLLSLLLDIPQARTLWLRSGPRSVPGIFTAGVIAKVVIGYLEARSKKRSLFPQYRVHAPEALVSLYDRTTLWWLNPLFWLGYKSFLTVENLYTIDEDLGSEAVEERFASAWKEQSKGGNWPLLWATFRSVRLTVLSMVAPRFCFSALKLCQPLLIARITSILSEGLDSGNANGARGLIGAAALIYLGIAISTAMYQRQLHRMITKVRGVIVTAVYSRLLELDSSKLSDQNALTLISADLNRISLCLQTVDNLFATPVEIGVAIYLLRRQVGVSSIAPVAISILISVVSFFNSNIAIPMQKKWLAAVSERVAFISSALGFPKGIKMLGLTDYLAERIQSMRVAELVEYAHYRKYVTWRNLFAHIPMAFAPPLTLMMFTLIEGGKALNPSNAFASLALVALLTEPIQNLIHAVPQFQTALASIQRVQIFLLLDRENRPNFIQDHMDTGNTTNIENYFELRERTLRTNDCTDNLLCMQNVTVSLGTEPREVLHNINLGLKRNALHLLVGPVGSGKSVLLKSIVGDIAPTAGVRYLNQAVHGIAYCAQDSWIPNDTIRAIVIGNTGDIDLVWYNTVLSACALKQDIAGLAQGDDTLVGTKGVTLSGGQRQRLALARAIYARKSLVIADDILSGLDAATSRHVFGAVFGATGLCRAHGMTVLMATHVHQYLTQADHIVILDEGRIAEQGSFEKLISSEGYLRDFKPRGVPFEITDSSDDVVETSPNKPAAAPDKIDTAQQDLARKTGDMSVYSYYFKSIGWPLMFLIVLSEVGFAFGTKFPDLWVRRWSEAEASGSSRHSLGFWIGIFFLIAFVGCASVFANIWIMLIHAVPRSSAKLHHQLLNAVMHATYSFLTKTDSGVTLNRFSNDMSMIETALAGSLMQFMGSAAICLGSAALIASGADYAAVTMPFVALVLYLIQRFYLRTSRQLRFLELEAQAPLLSHCSETLAGVTTIRAFGWQRQSHEKCLRLLDRSQRAAYLQFCIQRWLNFVLALVTAAVAVVVVAMALTVPSTSSAGAIGVSLLGILSFSGTLASVVEFWTSLETSLGAVARCKNFEKTTPSEDMPGETSLPPSTWPQTGKLEIKNTSASYDDNTESVLRSISLSVGAGEKVGICGRSGSGKSSLLLTLFRLLGHSVGSIEVDGIELSTLPRQVIRERFCALPQETITFPGTISLNLDTRKTKSNIEIETALERVGLKEAVARHGGLETDISVFNFSQGQLQLFAVARALLRKSKLLVVDEMTSSVDSMTEQKVLQVIREEFEDSTVIAVAHRLKTIVDFDKIVVMDDGRVVEVGTPAELLARDDGAFKSMWESSGH